MKNSSSLVCFCAVFLLLGWFAGSPPRAAAQGLEGVTVTSIDVHYVGPETIAKDRILANMKTKIGSPYSEATSGRFKIPEKFRMCASLASRRATAFV